VASVDARRRTLLLAHNEEVHYDTLIVASGGRAHLPEELAEFRELLDGFGSFEQAMVVRRKMREDGTLLLLGGDMIGLDLARTLVDTGHRVLLYAQESTFWPHQVEGAEREELLAALGRMGIEVLRAEREGAIRSIHAGTEGRPARLVSFARGREVGVDVVLPSLGLVPSVEFMLGSGVDIERGILVNPELRTTDEAIYAAGDVCQIWSAQEKRYRFYYGWKNVRAMGELAARNATGEHGVFTPMQDETLHVHEGDTIHSPFWEYA